MTLRHTLVATAATAIILLVTLPACSSNAADTAGTVSTAIAGNPYSAITLKQPSAHIASPNISPKRS